MACRSFFSSLALSTFSFVCASARFMASCACWSFSFRKASNRMASSSSISSLFFSASSFCAALCSSFAISSRLMSSDICTRNISRFLAMNSAMDSRSCRRSRAIAAVAAVTRPLLSRAFFSATGSTSGAISSIMRRVRVSVLL